MCTALLPSPRTAEAAGITLVRTGTFAETYSGGVTLTLPAASTPGNLLVASVAVNSTSAGAVTAPSGWVNAVLRSDGSTQAGIWYYPNNPGGISSALFSAGNTAVAGVLTEWAGVATTSPLDGTGAASAANTTSVTVSTSAPVAGDLAIAAFGILKINGGTMTTTPSSGWVSQPRDATADWFHFGAAYRINAASGVATDTQSANSAVYWSAAIASFKAATVATPDFQVAASPASRVVTNASATSTTFSTTVSSIAGYSSNVALTATSSPALPSGVTTAFAPSSVTPTAGGANSTLTVSVPAGATVGSYTITIRGTGPSSLVRTTTVTLVISVAGNPIVTENQQPGTTAWKQNQGTFRDANDTSRQVKGFASTTSVGLGENITFYVTVNPVQTVSIDIYRIGWYGGAGGRLMQHVGPLNGVSQPACNTASTTLLVTCPWASTYTLSIPTTWTSGTYLAQLTNAQGFQNYVPFVVRDGRAAPLLYQQSVTTYQAYNGFSTDGAARSLYTVPQATKVSFDRPYETSGAAQFMDFELAFVQWLERSGYDVTYSTNIDTHARGSALLNSKAFLSVGHDEYWSKEMYDAAEQARDAGVSLGFFGANQVYWQVRFEPSAGGTPNRVMVGYKSAATDPVQGPTTTVRWREAPVNRPEQQLVGVQFTSQIAYSTPNVPYIVQNASHWIYQGTGVSNGTSIPNVVGYEMDKSFTGVPLPVSTERTILSASPYTSYEGVADVSNAAIYRAPSGAWVFAASSIRWGQQLDPVSGESRIRQMTANLMTAFTSTTASGNFAIAASPASRSVSNSSATSTTFTTTLTSIAGYNSAVALSVSSSPALPAGVTTAFAPSSVTPTAGGANSTLTVTLPAGTAVGTYTLTITGTGPNSLVKTTTVTLVVSPASNFQIAASPASRTVTNGSATSTTYTTTLTSIAGYNSAVVLSVSSSPALPAGVTTAFAPSSVTPTAGGANSTLTVTLPSGATAGTYTLTITGTGPGSLIRTTTATLVISPPADFQVAAAPVSRTLSNASATSTSYTTTLTSVNGYSSSVALSVTSSPALPSGVTTAFAPTSVTPTAGGATSTLTVTLPAGAAAGTYTLTIRGTGPSSLVRTTTVSLVISATGPSPVALVRTGAYGASYTGALTLTLPAASNPGTLLVASIATNGAVTVTPPAGWVNAALRSDGNTQAGVWYYPNNPGGITSALFNSGTTGIGGVITEWSGIAASSPLDGSGGAAAANVTSVTVSTSAPVAGDLAIASFGILKVNGGTMTTTPGASWVSLPRDASADWFHTGAAYRIGAPAGIVTDAQTANSAVYWSAALATFKAASSAGPDFQVAASPASRTVTNSSASSAAYTTTLTSIAGYNSAVALSVTSSPALPSGVTTAFAPASVTPTAGGANSTLTVTLPSGAAAGTYTLTIRGTGPSSFVRTTTVTLVVSPPSDFQIAAAPASRTLSNATAGSTSFTTTLTALNGYNSAVALSVTSSPALPSGVTAAFAPTSVTPTAGGATSTLTVTLPAGATTGTYTLTIRGTGPSSLVRTTTATLVISASGPSPVALVSTSAFNESYSGAVTLTLPAASSAGRLLVASVAVNGTGAVSAPAGWVQATLRTDGNTQAVIWYYPNNPGGITSAIFNAGTSAIGGVLTEWSGIATSSPLDGSGGASAANVANVTVSTSAPVTGDLAIASFGILKVNGGTMTTTPGASWVSLPRDATADWFHTGAAYRIGAPAGIVTDAQTANSAVYWSAALATFRAGS